MSPKLKCHQIWNVAKTQISLKQIWHPKRKCPQNWNVIRKSSQKIFITETEISENLNITKNKNSPKLKNNQNWKGTKIAPKLKCRQNQNILKSKMSSKLKCHQNWNDIRTDKSPKMKLYCTTGLSYLTWWVCYWWPCPCFNIDFDLYFKIEYIFLIFSWFSWKPYN